MLLNISLYNLLVENVFYLFWVSFCSSHNSHFTVARELFPQTSVCIFVRNQWLHSLNHGIFGVYVIFLQFFYIIIRTLFLKYKEFP